MKFQDAKAHRNIPFSIFFIENSVMLYLCIFAALTLLTHLAQVLELTFRVYSYLSLTVSVLVLFFLVPYLFKKFHAVIEKDYSSALGIFALCIFGAVVSVIYHRVGRISPDEFYYAANPVYFLANPDAKMGFQLHTFYSREHFFGIAYLTAGAFEYIQAVLSFFLDARFATTYYFIGAGLTGFMICASYYLLLHWFVPDSKLALLGTFSVVCSILLMGERPWTPGTYSFMRAFEGKSFFLFAGLPLFAYFSLQFFDSAAIDRYLKLFVLTTTLAGMTTSSIPIVTLLGCVLFLSYSLTYLKRPISFKEFIASGLMYFLSFSYLIFYGACIAFFDDANAAAYFNQAYAYPFLGYVLGFVHYPFPTTAVFLLIFSMLACLVVRGREAVFLRLWMALTLILILNPLAAKFFLIYFTGVYFRFFYIFPFPLVVGLTMAFAGFSLKQYSPNIRNLYTVSVTLAFLIFLFILPTSIFRLGNYGFGNVMTDREFIQANRIVSLAPKGVMLAPYPLSGAIQMLDGNFPQLIHRDDIIRYYLTVYDQADGELRVRAGAFAAGDNNDFNALLELVSHYPELHSIILNKQAYNRFKTQIQGPLMDMGFDSYTPPGFVIFTR